MLSLSPSCSRDFALRLTDDSFSWRADDPKLTAGVPAAVQLVGMRWRDEELLSLGEVVANLCDSKNWKQ